MDTKTQLTNQIRSGKAGIYVLTWEQARCEAELLDIAAGLNDPFAVYAWSTSQGVVEVAGLKSLGGNDPLDMLDIFQKLPQRSLMICRDLHLLLDNPFVIAKVKDATRVGER